MMKTFLEVDRYLYENADGSGERMERVKSGKTPDGLHSLIGRWVLYSAAGTYIDHDVFRHDLAERHGIMVTFKTE